MTIDTSDPNIQSLITEIQSVVSRNQLEELNTLLKTHPQFLKEPVFGLFETGLLHYAAGEGQLEACRQIVESGAPIDASFSGETALYCAASQGDLPIVKWLAEKGASLDGDPRGIDSPLTAAISLKHTEVATFLIENGADLNRVHIRLHQTPLDLAKIWGLSEIEKLLLEKGAHPALSPKDWSGKFAGPILHHMETVTDHILPIEIMSDDIPSDFMMRIAMLNKTKNRLLFTTGLFKRHNPMLELSMVLPEYWNMYDLADENRFPSILLSTLAQQVEKGLKVEEGFCIEREDPIYSALPWPDYLAGFCVCDHYWGRDVSEDERDDTDENTVRLWTLIPVKKTKKGFPKQSIEKNRKAGWAKLTLKMDC